MILYCEREPNMHYLNSFNMFQISTLPFIGVKTLISLEFYFSNKSIKRKHIQFNNVIIWTLTHTMLKYWGKDIFI